MKRLNTSTTGLLACLLIIIGLSPQALALTDVVEGTLEGNAALYLESRGIVSGFPDGEFKGERPVNRAEAAKFLLLAKGIDVDLQPVMTNFLDVPSESWFAPYVAAASQREIIKGYGDGSYRPADQISTAEFLKMLGETFDFQKNLPHNYRDTSQDDPASSWYWQYAGAAQEHRLFPSRREQLLPSQPLTRTEVAMGLYQFLRRQHSGEISTPTPTGEPSSPTSERKILTATQVSTSTAKQRPNMQAILKFSLRSDSNFSIDNIELEALNSDGVTVVSAQAFDSSENLVAEATASDHNLIFPINQSITANTSVTLTFYAELEGLFLGDELSFRLDENGVSGSFADGSKIILDQAVEGLTLSSMTPEEVAYPDAPNRIQVEGGYIAYQDNPEIEALALDFNFGSPTTTSYWQDVDIQADTSRLGEFLVMFRKVPANGERIVIGFCNITFQSGGGSDSDCSDNSAQLDTTSYNSPSALANALSNFSGFSNHTIELVTAGSVAVRFTRQAPAVDGNLAFADFTDGKIVRMIKAIGRSAANNPLSSILSTAELRINKKIVAQATTITADRIQFRDMSYRLAGDQTYEIEVIPFPKRIGTGGAQSGQAFVLSIPSNALTPAQNGEVLSPSGSAVFPGVKASTGEQIVIAQAVPVIDHGGPISSNHLSVGTLDFLRFTIAKMGEGSVEIGSSLSNSQFQVRLFKSPGVAVESCDIRDSSSTIATAIADPSSGGTFYQDAYGKPFADLTAVTNAQIAYATFTPETFSGGKRLEGNGHNYTLYCSITAAASSTSMQASIDLDTQISFIENNNSELPLSDTSLIKKLPINGTSRVSN